jgi:hypothetical protein
MRRCGEVKGLDRRLYLSLIADKTYSMLQRIADATPNVFVTFPGRSLCQNENCALYANCEFLYRDTDHIRRNLSVKIEGELANAFGIIDALRQMNSIQGPAL